MTALIAGAAVTALFAVFVFTNAFSLFQLKLADNLYTPGGVSDEIVIVAIDDYSQRDDLDLGFSRNWSRSSYAQVVNNLKKYGARLIVFDMSFVSNKDEEGDRKFIESIEAAGNVIMNKNFSNSYVETNEFYTNEEIPLMTDLDSALGKELVTVVTFLDEDDVLRKYIPGVTEKLSGTRYSSLAFAVAGKMGFDMEKVPLEKGMMIINYFSEPLHPDFAYPYVSFVNVFADRYGKDGQDPYELFKDKIVLIGPTSEFYDDYFLTPAGSGQKMPGVEVHANAIQTILEGKFLRNESAAEKIIVLLLLCMAGAFVFMFTKIRWSLLFLAVMAGSYTAASPLMFARGVILDLIHPYLALAVTFIGVFMYRYLTEFKEKNALKNAFSKYVSPDVVEKISEQPEGLKLGGVNKEVSVLFTDIEGFTSISENLKPESLVALLNEYFSFMSEVIMQNGGTLDKFEGDAIMAFFGAPLDQPDHAERACSTALAMRQKLVELNAKWANDPPLPGGEKKPQIDFRCGVNSGNVIVGNMGSENRFDYTVMGDTVNLASRLEGANKKYETRILASEFTRAAVNENFATREIDLIKVVGKKQTVRVYEILGPADGVTEEGKRLLTMYNEGLDLYRKRDFALALDKFAAILKDFPDDGPSKIYRQRCEVLKDFPPPKEWDGIFEMKTK